MDANVNRSPLRKSSETLNFWRIRQNEESLNRITSSPATFMVLSSRCFCSVLSDTLLSSCRTGSRRKSKSESCSKGESDPASQRSAPSVCENQKKAGRRFYEPRKRSRALCAHAHTLSLNPLDHRQQERGKDATVAEATNGGKGNTQPRDPWSRKNNCVCDPLFYFNV